MAGPERPPAEPLTPERRPPGEFVSPELASECARFLEDVKNLVDRRNSPRQVALPPKPDR